MTYFSPGTSGHNGSWHIIPIGITSGDNFNVIDSYGCSPDIDWGGNAYCVNPFGNVDFYNDGNIFFSYGTLRTRITQQVIGV